MQKSLINPSAFHIVVVVMVFTFLDRYRMYPVVIANGRSLQSDAIINGYHIPKGVSCIWREREKKKLMLVPNASNARANTLYIFLFQTNVIFPHLVVSNDPAYFPEPKSFQPERWLKQSETNSK